MIISIRIAVIVIGVFFLLPGFVGVFRPERLAEALALSPDPGVGVGSIRALIGAPYVAMGVVTIYAAVWKQWAWLAPVAAIEGFMVLARIVSAFNGELDTSAIVAAIAEAVICFVLALSAILPARSTRQG